MKVAAIFPVGTSVGGCPDSIAEILKEEPALDVHLLYGNRGAPDAPDPHDFARQIRASIDDEHVTWAPFQAVEAYDMSVTYTQVRAFVAGVSEQNYGRVYVGVTGGTNPMVASLFQTAMAYLSCQVIPVYLQARGTARVQHFSASDVRDRVTAEEALSAARSGQIRVAARLADRLPPEGALEFLRKSLTALSYWDDFDYYQAKQTLVHQARKSAEYAREPLLSPVADTVARLAGVAAPISAFAKEIRVVQNFAVNVTSDGWAERLSRCGLSLVADVLANAQRRIVEGRFTDSVLRSYRAAECATQMRLVAIRIHPAKVDADPCAWEQLRAAGAPEAKELAFVAGLRCLAAVGQLDFAPIEDLVRNLCGARNHTYLEHGYDRVQLAQAERCFELSMEICRHLTGADIDQAWREFQMRF